MIKMQDLIRDAAERAQDKTEEKKDLQLSMDQLKSKNEKQKEILEKKKAEL